MGVVGIAVAESPEAVVAQWPYQTEQITLLPYTDGAGDWPDDLLVRLYAKAKADHLIGITFPGVDGKITLPWFVSYMRDKPLVVGVVKATQQIAGVGWLHEVQGGKGARKASVGFLFFREFWGTSEIRTIAQLALDWWFQELEVDVLYGFTLQGNALAQAFGRELGFRKVADLPLFFSRNGKFENATCVMQTREEFHGRPSQRHGTSTTDHR